MLRINIIGCGNVGQTLGRLWHKAGTFSIGDICNRSLESSCKAVECIGAGNAISSLCDMHAADVFLIGAADNSIPELADALAETGILNSGNIVFHCSGALGSDVLSSVQKHGAFTASTHPIQSFPAPSSDSDFLLRSYFGCEGAPEALAILQPAIASLGAKTIAILSEQKSLYHAASVISCNYLTSLLELSAQSYEKAGISREDAMQIMQPMVQSTVTNIFNHGTTAALTGPISRGDNSTVSQQIDALQKWDEGHAQLYRELGKIALGLASSQENAESKDLSVIQKLLEN